MTLTDILILYVTEVASFAVMYVRPFLCYQDHDCQCQDRDQRPQTLRAMLRAIDVSELSVDSAVLSVDRAAIG